MDTLMPVLAWAITAYVPSKLQDYKPLIAMCLGAILGVTMSTGPIAQRLTNGILAGLTAIGARSVGNAFGDLSKKVEGVMPGTSENRANGGAK